MATIRELDRSMREGSVVEGALDFTIKQGYSQPVIAFCARTSRSVLNENTQLIYAAAMQAHRKAAGTARYHESHRH